MALSLLLRNAKKIQGYPCILRCTSSAFRNVGNVSYLTSSTNVARKPLLTVTSQMIKPVTVRNMAGHGDHRLMWTIERIISAVLLGVLPIAIIAPSPFWDNTSVILMVAHLHWGLEAMCQDYIRPIIFGHAFPKIAIVIVYLLTSVTLGGLLYFNYCDIGVGHAVRKIWSIKPSGSQEC